MMRGGTLHVFWGTTSLLAGVLFYTLVRGYIVSPELPISPLITFPKSVIANSFPSFIHSFALMFLCLGFGMRKKRAAQFNILLGVALEVIPPLFSRGTYDTWDLLAVALGVLAAHSVAPEIFQRVQRKWVGIPLMGFGVFTGLASFSGRPPIIEPCTLPVNPPSTDDGLVTFVFEQPALPVYMSYEQLRSSFAVEEPRPLREAGKILVLGSRLLVSEPNVGVHIFDNSNPAAPQIKFFLNIPGNVDLAAKNGIVYADSFVDLLAIRIDGEKPELVKRIPDTFSWNPYQSIKDSHIRFKSEDLDKRMGVVVGSEKQEKSSQKSEADSTAPVPSPTPGGTSQDQKICAIRREDTTSNNASDVTSSTTRPTNSRSAK